MTELTVSEKQPSGVSGVLDSLANFLSNAIDRTDEAAALERVSTLQESCPDAGVDELVARLIRDKCLRTGGMGFLTPGLSLIGVPINLGLIFKWQAELVLEIAAIYNWSLNDAEKRRIVLVVAGITVGTTQVTRLFTKWVERTVSRQVVQSRAARSTLPPLVGSIVSTSANVLFTYLIGKRAQTYFQRTPQPLPPEPDVKGDPSGNEDIVD
jgi:uncharacterized protein (DUF697 family)